MNAALMPFTNGEFELSVIADGSDFRVLAPALAQSLGFRDAHRMLETIPESEKGYTTARTPGGEQRVTYLTEAGFYRCIGQRQAARISDEGARASVERFQSWVYAEVLPAIRKRGGYLTPDAVEQALTDPDFIIRLATDLKAERAKRTALEAQAEADAPKVLFAEAVATSSNLILVRELAKLMQHAGIAVRPQTLFEWLRRDGFLIRAQSSDYNLPTQKSKDLRLFDIKETPVIHDDGRVTVSRTPKVTGKGQTYLINHYLTKVAS